MAFIRNVWYVAAWSNEVSREKPVGRTIIGEPVVLFRKADGSAVALEDRCAHRHAPLSLGRIEGDDLRCMYHGLKFNCTGTCIEVPGMATVPARTSIRAYPVVEKSDWIWVWLGDPQKMDVKQVPDAIGLRDPNWVMREGALDYEADYQLIHDNLCDLSHIDFVHARTLQVATGASYSTAEPIVKRLDNGILVDRWLLNARPPGSPGLVDIFNRYTFLLPGIFLLETSIYPAGTAAIVGDSVPQSEPIFARRDQQAVTPISENRARYLYASGGDSRHADPEMLTRLFGVINAAFEEDRVIIEAQQKIWNLTSPEKRKTFIPQDKGPTMMRQLIAGRLAEEAGSA